MGLLSTVTRESHCFSTSPVFLHCVCTFPSALPELSQWPQLNSPPLPLKVGLRPVSDRGFPERLPIETFFCKRPPPVDADVKRVIPPSDPDRSPDEPLLPFLTSFLRLSLCFHPWIFCHPFSATPAPLSSCRRATGPTLPFERIEVGRPPLKVSRVAGYCCTCFFSVWSHRFQIPLSS